jgi:aryl-alcohol dehydrogenase-like predicted oxidoreductase
LATFGVADQLTIGSLTIDDSSVPRRQTQQSSIANSAIVNSPGTAALGAAAARRGIWLRLAALCYPFSVNTTHLRRREFLKTGLLAGGCLPACAAKPGIRRATDVVELGPDKVKLSRLAMGTGTRGYAKSSNQTRKLGLQGLADLLRFGYDNGLIFWDSADGYGSHPHVKEALKTVAREKVTILTKTRARTAEEMRADLDRFRQEIGTDYLDIVLLHAMMQADWPEPRKGAMEVLSEARQKGTVHTHGVSCHSFEALKTIAKTPWARANLIRINAAGVLMDADPKSVVPVMRGMKANGQGVIGMKILGEGQLRDRVDEMLRFALSLDCLDCFTIGVESRQEVADLIKRIPGASQAA